MCARECLFKTENIFNCSTAEFVNALIVIAYHAKVLAFLGEQFDKHILRMVRVLILVHQDISELVLEIRKDIRTLQKQVNRIAD